MAYFAALGYLLEESGRTEILAENDILASGSVNGFLMGKHYNRCKRLHPLLASGLQTLHFRRFIKDKGALNDNLMQLFIETNSNLSDESISKLEASKEYIDLMGGI